MGWGSRRRRRWNGPSVAAAENVLLPVLLPPARIGRPPGHPGGLFVCPDLRRWWSPRSGLNRRGLCFTRAILGVHRRPWTSIVAGQRGCRRWQGGSGPRWMAPDVPWMCHERQFTRFPASTGPPPNTRLHEGPEQLHQPKHPERWRARLAQTNSDRKCWSSGIRGPKARRRTSGDAGWAAALTA